MYVCRALINVNDGLGGGLLVHENVLFNSCRGKIPLLSTLCECLTVPAVVLCGRLW
jgi:hypothetical protein